MKSRRYKVECYECGSVFNNDYKQCHEKKVHGGAHVRVKTVNAPENPFQASKKQKIQATDEQPTPSESKEPQFPSTSFAVEENQSEILTESDMDVDLHKEIPTDTTDTESSPENLAENEALDLHHCLGKFADLLETVTVCRNILNEVQQATIVDKYTSVIRIIDAANVIKKSCEETLSTCAKFKQQLENESKNYSVTEVSPEYHEIVNHDPGLREPLRSDNQRNFLISLGPHQPVLARFPTDGQHRFNPRWYREYEYLEYSTAKDAAYCYVCFLFPTGSGRDKAEQAWISEGVRGWKKMKSMGKDVKGKLDKHFSSNAHKCALNDFSRFLIKKGHVDILLDKDKRKALVEEERIKSHNKNIIKILLDVAKTLARQGLAFRGSEDDTNGNFFQIVHLVARHNPVLQHWIDNIKFRPYHVSYLSCKSQNEFIQLIAKELRFEISNCISKSPFIAIMADTTPDSSNKDILSVVIRSVDDDCCPKERLIHVLEAQDKTGVGIAKDILKSLDNMQIDVKKLAFQSYDFAASMSGVFNCTQQKISELIGRKVPYIPCQAHRTNTAVEHSINSSKIIADFFSVLEDLYVFFTSSTKRFQQFKNKIGEIENSLLLKNLSKTRWTARAETIEAVHKSLEGIIELLHEISETTKIDAKTKTKAYGLFKKILNFDFLVSLMFMKFIMFKCQNLTKLLESPELNVIDVTTIINSTVKSLNFIRNSDEEIFNLIECSKIFGSKLNINADQDFNKHHRRRLLPRRLEDNPESQVEFTINSFYRHHFVTVIDTLTSLLTSNVQNCIVNLKPLFDIFAFPIKRQNLSYDNLSAVLQMFPNDEDIPNIHALQSELEILFDSCSSCENMSDVVTKAREMKYLKLQFRLIQFVVAVGYTVATNERKFSLLKLIKNDIRARMSDERLCDLMLIKSEKDLSDKLNNEKIIQQWSELKNRRITL